MDRQLQDPTFLHRMMLERTCALSLALFVVAGCGHSDYAPVKGMVTYRGKALEKGRVVFTPTQGRPAFGDINAQGEFQLTTVQTGDGASLGNHRVTVFSDTPSVAGDEFSDRKSLIPARYQDRDKSPLTADVQAGKNRFTFELKD